MKKLAMFAVLVLYLSCNTAENKTDKTDSSKMMSNQSVQYPYPIMYSSQFEIGNPEYAKMVLDLWKDFDENQLDKGKGMFADTVTMLFSGSEMHGSRDSMLASTKTYRDMFTTVNSTVDAVFSVKSTDKNENWVLVWGTEHHTGKDNKTDSVHLQETWRINNNGKVDLLMQYQRVPPPPMKK